VAESVLAAIMAHEAPHTDQAVTRDDVRANRGLVPADLAFATMLLPQVPQLRVTHRERTPCSSALDPEVAP
jgi:hypothetical protein